MGTPLADVLPEFAEPEVFVSWDEEKQVFVTEPAKQKIRMKHLFTHTSGNGHCSAFTQQLSGVVGEGFR